jgi:hypothetical protein
MVLLKFRNPFASDRRDNTKLGKVRPEGMSRPLLN